MQHENDDDDIDTILSSVFVAKKSTKATAASTKMLAKLDGDTGSAAMPTKKASQGPSCRAVLFSDSSQHSFNADDTIQQSNRNSGGEHLFTACNGGSLRCLDTSRLCSLDPSQHDDAIVWSVENAHHVGICKLYQLPQSSPAGSLVVTGDDVGAVRLWDVRLCGGELQQQQRQSTKQHPFDNLMKPPQGCVMQWKVNHDYITDFCSSKDGTHLLSTSADGTLTVFDVRFVHRKNTPRSIILPDVDLSDPNQMQKMNSNTTWEKSGYVQSDNQEDELLSLCLLKNSTKVLCGSQQGILSLFSYGKWADISDRFPGHPQSIDALLKIDEDTVLTGSSDGLVRAVQLLPNALLGVLGSHEGFPVEGLGWSAGRKMVGSLSHDEFIRLWDGSFLEDDGEDEESEDEKMMEDEENAKRKGDAKDEDEDEWEDMDEDMDDDDDSDDTDSDDSEGRDAKPKKRPNMFKSANEEFFQDL